jgi:hypothetical protein
MNYSDALLSVIIRNNDFMGCIYECDADLQIVELEGAE